MSLKKKHILYINIWKEIDGNIGEKEKKIKEWESMMDLISYQ